MSIHPIRSYVGLERRPQPDDDVDATTPEPAVEPWTPNQEEVGDADAQTHHDPKPGEQTDPDETGPGTSDVTSGVAA